MSVWFEGCLRLALQEEDVMEFRARLFAIILGFAVLLFVINLVRTKKLKEEFALLWLLTGVVLVLTPLFIDYLDMLAYALGIEYPPALIFVLAIISLLFILFQFSMRISRFSDQIKVLTQELALLQARVELLEQRAEKGESDAIHDRHTT
ncbi:MAG: DUF2304 domain-containing protein [Chloroflexi bacterium]|nr:DUF2304 domain-containing protein [Chloroflexota bacterium]